jgi:nucleoside-diphosphate-sugar epimerase
MLEELGPSLPLVTILPSIVYGPDWPDAPSRLTRHMHRLLKRSWRVSIGSDAPRNLVYVEDVVRAIVNAETIGKTGERCFVGGENATQEEFERAVFRAAGVPATPRITIPPPIARAAATAADLALRMRGGCGYRGRVDALLASWTFDDVPAGDLRVVPTSLDEGIRRTLRAGGLG